ncbi:MAG TPA: hypothetical protein VJ983_00905 [candidate division Zixibacteria bacterium]|nr:hypothetical protein [candidate division Zixibacteria bacterium]
MNGPAKYLILAGALLFAVVSFAVSVHAQTDTSGHSQRQFEEIVVSFEVPKLVRKDVFVQYDGNTVYVPISDVFNLLDINIDVDQANKTYSGFFLSKDKKYSFDMKNFEIKLFGKDYPYLASEYYIGEHDVFLRVDLYKKLFGLDVEFDFSMLRLYLPLNRDFPAYQKLQRKIARQKLKQKAEAVKDVVHLQNRRELLAGASADWMLSTSPLGGRSKHYYSTDLGALLLGGDLQMRVGGNSDKYFDPSQLTYKWHYFFNDHKYLTQAEVGKIATTGALGRGLTGAMVTNRPQVRRKYFQTIDLSDYIGPNWEVELYVDNKLTDFMVTAEDGFYHFNMDIFYGASDVRLKMYGPNGELRTKEEVIRIPYTLIPKGEVEYSAAGGQSTVGTSKKPYAQGTVYYGLLDNLTVGANADIPVQPDKNEKDLVAGDVTYQALNNLTVNGSFCPSYMMTAHLNFSQPALLNFNSGFSKYFENPVRNPLNQLYNVNFSLSSPLRIGKRYLGLRYYLAIDKYQTLIATNMNYGFNANIDPIYLTYIGQYKKTKIAQATITNLASQILMSSQFIHFIRPQFRIDYDHTNRQISKFGVYLAKRIFRTGQLSVSMERNPIAKSTTFMVNFNLVTSFADFTSRVVRSAGYLSANQLQRGSIRYDQEDKTIQFDRRNSVGFGAAVVKPFLDDNYNGVMDNDEQYLSGLRAKMNGAHVTLRGKDREFYYDGLRPYEDYTVQIDQYSLDNPMLKPTHENYEVKVNPNMVTAIQVPIVTASEITGKVERQVGSIAAGLGGIKVVLMNLSKERLTELMTFSSGEFYYLGLVPGSYKAYIDQAQLQKYGYRSVPEYIDFEVKPVEGGSSIENINFKLVPAVSAEAPADK